MNSDTERAIARLHACWALCVDLNRNTDSWGADGEWQKVREAYIEALDIAKAELAALRRDKARLDWLETLGLVEWLALDWNPAEKGLRDLCDEQMQENA